MKRLFDVLFALALLPMAIPLTLVSTLLVLIVDRQSPMFVQTRVGAGGAPFSIVKLRTMKAGTPDIASHLTQASAVTPLGRVLRRIKLDELPQIVNVLGGTMSFVGPRPCLSSQTQLLEQRRLRGVIDLLPGITGPGQLAGLDMSTPKELAEADATYVGPWSLRRDVMMILQTAIGGGRGDAVKTG